MDWSKEATDKFAAERRERYGRKTQSEKDAEFEDRPEYTGEAFAETQDRLHDAIVHRLRDIDYDWTEREPRQIEDLFDQVVSDAMPHLPDVLADFLVGEGRDEFLERVRQVVEDSR